ncbi:VanZ family protein [Paenibacillus agricola]|uniref:VanZ family protein n=1 Tax=Paenibacillus agricola TaxID=2716264 RepID=UPI00140CED4D
MQVQSSSLKQTTLYGATDEIHQLYEPGRTPLVSDMRLFSCLTIEVRYSTKKTIKIIGS